MSYGLSDRDRERLERGRREAAEKMARERNRLEEEAEREAKDREHKARLGPTTVTGPDGVPVTLRVKASGEVDVSPTRTTAAMVACSSCRSSSWPGWPVCSLTT